VKKPKKKPEPKPAQPPKDRKGDSEDIERAVYDGMQDLRQEKPEPKR
jgi:hypothetical protein